MAEESIADKLQREILVSFLEEADEALEDIDTRLVQLESDPTDQDNIGAIFRAIHTIKGNSTFFGLMVVKQLAHQMEDLLDLLRQGKFACQSYHIDGLLAGVDELKAILARVRDQQDEIPEANRAAFDALLAMVLKSIEMGLGVAPPVVVTHIGALLSEPVSKERIAQWQATLTSLREVTAQISDESVVLQLDHLLENILELAPLDAIEEHAATLSANAPASPLQSKTVELPNLAAPPVPDLLPLAAAQPLDTPPGSSLPSPPAMRSVVPSRPSSPPSPLSNDPDSASQAASGSPGKSTPEARSAAKPKDSGGRTMRIEESSIEEFLDYVGELIITREMFGNVGQRLRALPELNKLSTEFQRAMSAFTALSHNLQSSIMKIRRVRIKVMLQKAPRIVRDVAHKQGKDAGVVLEGENIQVDKSLLEALEDPFVHMMRNAIDHGMEQPEIREAAGKPRKGTITVTVSETADQLLCRIKDDGGGIDAMKLKQKAVERGSLSASEADTMTPQAAFQLVFNAGLSTAEKVTEVSGRGVGMDVVKRNIVELGGHIEIESELGVGTTFTIHLPKAVSVQIFDGFLVRVGDERLVLPLRSVSESFRPLAEQVHTVIEKGECVERRGRVLPLLRSGDLLSMPVEHRSVTESIVVSIEAPGGHAAGLLVDEVLGVQQVVLREIDGLVIPGGVFSGGAVLGDGLVAMVVDVEKLSGLHL